MPGVSEEDWDLSSSRLLQLSCVLLSGALHTNRAGTGLTEAQSHTQVLLHSWRLCMQICTWNLRTHFSPNVDRGSKEQGSHLDFSACKPVLAKSLYVRRTLRMMLDWPVREAGEQNGLILLPSFSVLRHCFCDRVLKKCKAVPQTQRCLIQVKEKHQAFCLHPITPLTLLNLLLFNFS